MTTATSQSAHDKNGSQLFIGDEGLLRFKVTDVREGNVLTTSFEPPHREYWFPGSLIERLAQASAPPTPASMEAERKAAVASGANAAAPAATAASSSPGELREQAIAWVMSKGRDRATAEKVVEEYGTRMLLEDRDEEAKKPKDAV